MTDPNAGATAASNADKLDGTDGLGNALRNRLVAMFYDAHTFGRSKDYAFPEGSNTSPSALDHVTSVTKLTTRTQKLADLNDYDIWDCIFTLTKWVLKQDIHINDDEPLSVNHVVAPPKAV
jgi:hypothetical protein